MTKREFIDALEGCGNDSDELILWVEGGKKTLCGVDDSSVDNNVDKTIYLHYTESTQ